MSFQVTNRAGDSGVFLHTFEYSSRNGRQVNIAVGEGVDGDGKPKRHVYTLSDQERHALIAALSAIPDEDPA